MAPGNVQNLILGLMDKSKNSMTLALGRYHRRILSTLLYTKGLSSQRAHLYRPWGASQPYHPPYSWSVCPLPHLYTGERPGLVTKCPPII